MKSYTTLALFIASGLMMNSCFNDDQQSVIGTGDVLSMEVDVPAFSGVSVTGRCHVVITAGEEQFVELHAQQEILDVMTSRVRDGVLLIGFKNGTTVHTDEEIRAEIRVPAIDYIAVTGAGDFDLTGPKQERFEIDITGTGNVEAYELETDHVQVFISGAGNCRVLVNESLDVNISGVGNVFYKGTPEISSNISGVGNVIDQND